jgi:hypothetical protein
MKKIYLFLLAICVCVANVYSQLQVDSTGYVGIGITDEILEDEEADSIMSTLAVGTVGSEDEFASLYSDDKPCTISAYNRMNRSANGVGIYSNSYSKNRNSQGIVGVGTAGLSESNSAIGVRGTTYGAANSVGVYGGSYIFNIAYENFAGVFGTTSSAFPYFQHSGVYAGYFDGTVRATGPMYAQAFYTPSANPTGGSNIENTSVSLIGEEENVTDKLRNVSSFELQHTEQATATKKASPADEFLKGRNIQDLTKKELHQLDSICMNTPAEKTDPLSSVNYGLDAAQLKAVFPKLVRQDKEGNYSINYVEMVPLLVKSINEMSAKIETLEQQLEVEKQAKRVKSETTGIENNVSDIDMVRMDQNKPNPFSESTVIGLNIPEKTQKANIFIYDLSGKQIQNVPVAERGETNITVYASELGAGMYIYTLVVDGKVVVTRRMIVE